jgi:hypothetical protein
MRLVSDKEGNRHAQPLIRGPNPHDLNPHEIVELDLGPHYPPLSTKGSRNLGGGVRNV